MSQYRVGDADRPVLWYAGYVLGHITRNSHGLPYPDPPFGPDHVPDDADPELRRAIAYWHNPRVLACVADGQIVRELPPLHWLEESGDAASPRSSVSSRARVPPPTAPSSVPVHALKETLQALLTEMAAGLVPPDQDGDFEEQAWEEEEAAPPVTSPLLISSDSEPRRASRTTPPEADTSSTTEPLPEAFGLPAEGLVVDQAAQPTAGVLKRIATVRARVAKATAQKTATLRLTEGLMSFWRALTPARADIRKSDPDPITRQHELFQQHTLPEGQAQLFFAPALGPQTRQVLDSDGLAADATICLEADILGQAALRSLRWQSLLEETVSKIEKEGTSVVRTVAVDPVSLLEDMSAITQLNAFLFRQMQGRRLQKILKRFPPGSKARRPDDLYVSETGVLGGACMENSARSLYLHRRGPLASGGRGRRRPFRGRSATSGGVGRGSGSALDARTLSTVLRALAPAAGGYHRAFAPGPAASSYARGQPSTRRGTRRGGSRGGRVA